jgi:S-sulfosulfanyl-L-cysteine sulfohydrolase
VVVVLSHNGMDVDLKMASRVRGIDAIMGGHTHDGVPQPSIVKNAGGQTLVTNAGSNSKYLGVLDFDVKGGKVSDFRYKLLPVFSNMLPADAEMEAFINRVRQPYEAKLGEKLAVTEGVLYRRGNFNGTFDQLICDALMAVRGAEIAFSPGFRWGTSLLPGQPILMEHVLDQTAITYPATTVNEMSARCSRTCWKTSPTTSSTPIRTCSKAATWCAWVACTTPSIRAAKMGSRISAGRSLPLTCATRKP